MQTVSLGVSSLLSSRLAYGCWRLAGARNPAEVTPERKTQGRRAVIAAYHAGYTLFDNADIYCRGVAEEIFGEALRMVSEMRDRVLIATKCGIRFEGDPGPDAPHRYDFSAEHIVRSCEQSLKRMGVEMIDLYQLHRPDYLANPEEVADAFTQLKEAGKVRYFGVSNFRPTLVTALQVACPMPLVVHQVEISLLRRECFTDGTLDQCMIEKLTPLAWSPLAKGLLGGGSPSLPQEQAAAYNVEKVLPTLDNIAQARGVSRTVVALAWLLKHPSKIVPIVGSTNPDRIRDAAKAADVELTREEWYRLLLAARGEPLP
jgi:predicted oxidoreductase